MSVRSFFTRKDALPQRLTGTVWGILVVLSVTGSVSVVAHGQESTGTLFLAGLGALAAWSIVETGMAFFEGLLVSVGAPARRSGLERAALMTGVVLFVGALPILVPLVALAPWPTWALRVSNAVAILELFFVGLLAGRVAGGRPLVWGLSLVAFGGALVAVIVLLGG